MTLRIKSELIHLYLSGGYLFVKEKAISVYASIGAGVGIAMNYKTQFNYSTTIEIKENADKTINKVIVRPEAGIILADHFNVGITGNFRIDLPYYAFPNYTYEFNQLALIARYIFSLKKKQ